MADYLKLYHFLTYIILLFDGLEGGIYLNKVSGDVSASNCVDNSKYFSDLSESNK